MEPDVVEDEHVAGPQGWGQVVLNERQEPLLVHGAVEASGPLFKVEDETLARKRR